MRLRLGDCGGQADMYNKQKAIFESSIEKVTSWDEFMAALERKHMALAPWSAPLPSPYSSWKSTMLASVLRTPLRINSASFPCSYSSWKSAMPIFRGKNLNTHILTGKKKLNARL